MLTIEELQNSIRYSIELDHSYTSRHMPSQQKPLPTPVLDDSLIEMDDSLTNKSSNGNNSNVVQLNITGSTTKSNKSSSNFSPKVVLTPANVPSRPRRASTVTQQQTAAVPQNETNEDSSKSEPNDREEDSFPSSESSSTEKSDSDSDFGPTPPRRGVRSRGGRRGLTTRGGSMSGIRSRRSSNKQMDTEQAKRLDLEMAAAVDAMKTPEKQGPSKVKKLKTIEPKKKEVVAPPPTPPVPETPAPIVETPSTPVATPAVETNVLQTTNQVKANLIKDNMIEGGMILTRPGQDRRNQSASSTQQKLNELKTKSPKQLPVIRNIATLPANFIIKQIPATDALNRQKITVMSVQSDVPGVQKFIIANPQIHKQPIVHQVIKAQKPSLPPQIQTTSQVSQVPQISPTVNAKGVKVLKVKREKKISESAPVVESERVQENEPQKTQDVAKSSDGESLKKRNLLLLWRLCLQER